MVELPQICDIQPAQYQPVTYFAENYSLSKNYLDFLCFWNVASLNEYFQKKKFSLSEHILDMTEVHICTSVTRCVGLRVDIIRYNPIMFEYI